MARARRARTLIRRPRHARARKEHEFALRLRLWAAEHGCNISRIVPPTFFPRPPAEIALFHNDCTALFAAGGLLEGGPGGAACQRLLQTEFHAVDASQQNPLTIAW